MFLLQNFLLAFGSHVWKTLSRTVRTRRVLTSTCEGRSSCVRIWESKLEPACSRPLQSALCIHCVCLTLCDPMDCSPPGSSVPRILQARILEWVAIPFSRGSSWSRDWTWLSCIAGRFFTIWAAREAQVLDRYTYFHVYALSYIFHIVFRLLFACPQIFFSW